MKRKTKIKISEIIELKKRLTEVNNIPLENIKFINDKGNGVYIDPKIINDFGYTGLNNVDFISTGFYKEGFDKE